MLNIPASMTLSLRTCRAPPSARRERFGEEVRWRIDIAHNLPFAARPTRRIWRPNNRTADPARERFSRTRGRPPPSQ
jgi:hypothetical protein